MFPSFVADKVSGLHALYATLAALFHRERTGEGQFVEVPMLESFTQFPDGRTSLRRIVRAVVGHVGSHAGARARPRPLQTKDGWIATSRRASEGANNFMKLGGIPDVYNSEEFVTAKTSKEKVALYNEAMREAAMTHTTEEWMELGDSTAFPSCAPTRWTKCWTIRI